MPKPPNSLAKAMRVWRFYFRLEVYQMRVVFSDRAYASVLAETTEKIKTETGGLFLGTVQDDTWYIIEAIDPGPKSIFEVAYFEYDQKYTQHLINKIANLYDKQLALIGLWHRHPGSFDQFSSTDDGTNAKYASMRKEGAISALVNIDPSFRITMYQVERPCRYRKISYDVGDNLIPDELLKFKTPDRFYSIMDNILYPSTSNRNSNGDYHRSASLSYFMDFILPQIQENKCVGVETNNLLGDESTQEQLIEEVIDDLTFMADTLGIESAMSLDDNYLTVYQESIDKTAKLYFMLSVVKHAVILSYEDTCYVYRRGLFTEAFGKAKSERDGKEKIEGRTKHRKQSGVVDSVIKIIKFNRNEE